MEISKGRLTSKKLIAWLNEKFLQLEITEYVVTSIVRTYFTADQYEGGAFKLNINFNKPNSININEQGTFHCGYFLNELQYYINNDYVLYLENKCNVNVFTLSNLELNVRKK